MLKKFKVIRGLHFQGGVTFQTGDTVASYYDLLTIREYKNKFGEAAQEDPLTHPDPRHYISLPATAKASTPRGG